MINDHGISKEFRKKPQVTNNENIQTSSDNSVDTQELLNMAQVAKQAMELLEAEDDAEEPVSGRSDEERQ